VRISERFDCFRGTSKQNVARKFGVHGVNVFARKADTSIGGDRQQHWDAVYRKQRPAEVSWYQENPVRSRELIRRAGVGFTAPIIDVGGGASRLVDYLLADTHPQMLLDSSLLDERTLVEWIARIHAQGIRRPGYPADRWAEQFCRQRLLDLGLEDVRLEPVELPLWEPRATSLRVEAGAERFEVPCCALPFSAATGGVHAELVAFDPQRPELVRGKASLYEVTLLRVPPGFTVQRRVFESRESRNAPAAARKAGFRYDPRGTLEAGTQVLPFGREIQHVMEPSMAAGALAFIGVLCGYPGGGCEYYVPYDGVSRAVPGVWITERDGRRLRALLDTSPVRIELQVDAECRRTISHNLVGELPGADEEWVVIGTHHDGPWSSAVEDASGMALVLAQAAYWARLPRAARPHRLVFLINAGHMAGGAGVRTFIERHRAALAHTVLEVHLEHAAREFVERDGVLVPSGEPEPRWWFTSRIAGLESAVWNAIESESLERSLLMTPDALAPFPTTDGGPFHLEQVPLVNFLSAPFYLFDPMDNLDKVHTPSLIPITRAVIRIIESTSNISSAAMRKAAISAE
jgi:hypothetical protein